VSTNTSPVTTRRGGRGNLDRHGDSPGPPRVDPEQPDARRRVHRHEPEVADGEVIEVSNSRMTAAAFRPTVAPDDAGAVKPATVARSGTPIQRPEVT
jgi:hypothetical protein